MAERVLVLEASTGTGSLALLDGDELLAEATVPMRGQDGERLMPAVVQLLGDAGLSTADVGRVVCSAGPGGFTGLRIAAAIGKGLAESLGVPLWGVSSLALLAAGARAADGTILAVLDAMRHEWYVRQFTWEATERRTVSPRATPARLTREEIVALASRTGATIVGVGGASFAGGEEATPLARDIVRLREGELLHPVDLAAWEPDYGRLAEAQVRWEAAHGRALGASA